MKEIIITVTTLVAQEEHLAAVLTDEEIKQLAEEAKKWEWTPGATNWVELTQETPHNEDDTESRHLTGLDQTITRIKEALAN